MGTPIIKLDGFKEQYAKDKSTTMYYVKQHSDGEIYVFEAKIQHNGRRKKE